MFNLWEQKAEWTSYEVSKQQHSTTETQFKMWMKTNQKPYNKFLINLVSAEFRFFVKTWLLRRSVCMNTSGKYFTVQTSLPVNKV